MYIQNHGAHGAIEYNLSLLLTGILVDVCVYATFILLGKNRTRMIVVSAFLCCFNRVTIVTITYFLYAIASLQYEVKAPFLIYTININLYYIFYFTFFPVYAGCCFLAAFWLRDTLIKPPFKHYFPFTILFIFSSSVVTYWYSDMRFMQTLSFLAIALMGFLVLCLLFFMLYFYTRLVSYPKNSDASSTKNTIDSSFYLQNFSKRELDVIRVILDGNYKYKEIAANLNISVYTVKFHLNRMYKKTGVSDTLSLFSIFSKNTSKS